MRKMLVSRKMSLMTGWLLISLGAAVDYDGTADMNLMYQDHNQLDPDLQPNMMEREDLLRNILFPKVFNPYSAQDISPNSLTGPKWLSPDTILVPYEDLDLIKGPMMKRISAVDRVVRPRPAKPGVQKWKIKKGRAGSRMICYFKLCSFRSPQY